VRRWRGDLVRMLDGLSPDGFETAAALVGFERAPVQPTFSQTADEKRHVTDESGRQAVSVDAQAHSAADEDVRMPFWRVEAVTHHSPESPIQVTGPQLSSADSAIERGSLLALPESPPLMLWPRLVSRLREAILDARPGREPDVDAVIDRLSRAAVLERLPRRVQRRWPVPLTVWMDRSRYLLPLVADQDEVVEHLQKRLGTTLQSHVVRAVERLPVRPREGTLLVLGDLGACLPEEGRGAVQEAWTAVGNALRQCGVSAVVLSPVPEERFPIALQRAWTVVPWESPAAVEPPSADLVERLLRVVSQAGLLQPGLLRALRQLLPEATVETEIALLAHESVRAHDDSGILLKPTAAQTFQAAFAKLEPPTLQIQVRDMIARWRVGLPPELLHSEVVAWCTYQGGSAVPPSMTAGAWVFFERLKNTMQRRPRWQMAAWRRYARSALALLPKQGSVPEDLHPVLEPLWAMAHAGMEAERPSWVSIEMAASAETAPVQRWELRHVGGEIRLERPEVAETVRLGSPVGVLDAQETVELVGSAQRKAVHSKLMLPLTPSQALELRSSQQTVRIQPWVPGEAVNAAGRDRYGLWAELVEGQRFRWIRPGRFMMGAPKSEGYPFEDLQHEVTLTNGIWLGETPVTQALWVAMMGKSPSYFQSPEHPVERVSWLDAVVFCNRLSREAGLEPAYYLDEACKKPLKGSADNEKGGGAVYWKREAGGYRLPTEAEWEYACRAGTTTMTWAGDLEMVGKRNASVLDAIAWYKENSRVGFELKRGGGSSNWPEKESDPQAGTHPVAKKLANPWGLYDMIGNVFEWCYDKFEPYQSNPQVDPVGTAGIDRVTRGGSWDDDKRYCRAASRAPIVPQGHSHNLGFRLARGPAPRGGTPVQVVERLEAGARDATLPQAMRWMPPGTFLMGSPVTEDGRWEDEGPQHEVTLTYGFWMGETPVTQTLWTELTGENPSHYKGKTLPVERMSWLEAVAFCNRLSEREGLTPAYAIHNTSVFSRHGKQVVWDQAADGFRLPTEAEWEYACRAGTQTPWWSGKDEKALQRVGWYKKNSGSQTHPVGTKPANPWGLHDVHGNVCEWCYDTYKSYQSDSRVRPVNTAGANRAFRGGSWCDTARICRSAYRYHRSPEVYDSDLGFRLARGPVPEGGDPGS